MITPDQMTAACVAYYPLKADTLDYSANEYDATAMGNLTFVPGRFGQAASTAGVPGNGVQLPASDFTQSGEDFTLALWACLSSDENIANGWAVIAGGLLCDNDNGALSYQMTYQLDGQTIVADFSFEASLTPGAFAHVAVTFDQALLVLTCYVNGAMVATFGDAIPSGALALMPFTATPYIGCAGPSSNQTSTFNGAIGDVTLFNIALDQNALDLLDGKITMDLPTQSSDGSPFGYFIAAVVVVFIGMLWLLDTRAPKIAEQVETEPSLPPPFDPAVAAQKIMQLCGTTPLPLNPMQVTRDQAGIPDGAYLKVDIGGCGAYLYTLAGTGPVTGSGFADAINVNCVTNNRNSTPQNQPIPNLLLIQQVSSTQCNPQAGLPFANQTVDYVVMQNTPLSDFCVTEIARVLRPGGIVGLWIDATTYASQIQQLCTLLGYPQKSITGPYEGEDEMYQLYQSLIRDGYSADRYPTPKILLAPGPR